MFDNFLEEVEKFSHYVAKREVPGFVVDEEVVHEVVLKVLESLSMGRYDEKKSKVSTYIYYVIRSVIVDFINKRNKLIFVDIDKCKESQLIVDKKRSEFYRKFSEVVGKYFEVVGKDFMRIVLADMKESEYSNRLRSATKSKVKGKRIVESWLGRKLTEIEEKCLEELRELI